MGGSAGVCVRVEWGGQCFAGHAGAMGGRKHGRASVPVFVWLLAGIDSESEGANGQGGRASRSWKTLYHKTEMTDALGLISTIELIHEPNPCDRNILRNQLIRFEDSHASCIVHLYIFRG
jgi:hypothetical protein